MSKDWFCIKEKSAGVKRLYLTWFIFNLFGEIPIRLIASFISLFTLLFSPDVKSFSFKYFKYLFNYTKIKAYKPSFLNTFKHILSFSNSLIDKMLAYSDNYKNINFESKETENMILSMMKAKKGAFFITNHIGNIEMMRAFIAKYKDLNSKITVFAQQKQCEIFNNFINNISKQESYVELVPIEDISVATGIESVEKIKNGEFVFMAGDRVSANFSNSSYEALLLNHKISLPLGVLKFAIMLNCPIFLTSCLKKNKSYTTYLKEINLNCEKQEKLEKLKLEFSNYLEEMTLKSPYEFYHFFDIFKD